MQLHNASEDQLKQWQQELNVKLGEFRSKNLNLDLTRGKPCAEQLSLSNQLDGILAGDYLSANGTDTRNYGVLEGIEEVRQLGAQMLGVDSEQVLAGGNSSLTLMFQVVMTAHLFGLDGPDSAWSKQGPVKFICPVPGYDRHFTVCEQFGIDMVTVPMNDNGPDMDRVEALLKTDDSIKGMWCVPKYSNPTGAIYSDETVERIAHLGTRAHKDFRVFWDNAYAVHDLVEQPRQLANIMAFCRSQGTENSVLQFTSTSKISFAGAGLAFFGASSSNLTAVKNVLATCTIGPDKVNQLRHAKLFPDMTALKSHMRKHAQIIKPRFDTVASHLEQAFADNSLGQWQRAEGGYFVSFNTRAGLAKRVVQLAKETGVKLTPAGATYPYGNDPEDKNIRLAPTVPSVEEVDLAMQVFTTCVKLASVEQVLQQGKL